MKHSVKDLVNKEWAKSAKEILTGSAPDITTLLTKLSTMSLEHEQKLKTIAARDRLRQALAHLNDGLKYGWSYGINAAKPVFTRPANKQPNRRVGALLPLAIAAGEAIGKAQAAKITKAHANGHEKGLGLHHTHASSAS